MLQKEFKSAVKSVLGTCASIGIFVENEEPNELIHKIDTGKFTEEIEKQATETSPEKRKRVNEFFEKAKKEQEELIAKEQAEAEEAEKAKEEAAEEVEGKEVEEKPEEEAGEAKPEEAEEAKE